MSVSFVFLAIFATGLSLIQLGAALPWLVAVDFRFRDHLRKPMFWVKGVGVGLVLGLTLALFFHFNSDPQALTRYGRIYASVLHLQLAADLFVGSFAVLLLVWPKGGAVALAAFREGVRQPMFWLLFAVFLFLMLVTPFIPYFTFGEDLKMVQELCFAFTMLGPAIFGVIEACTSVGEEIEGRTAITLMSKPVSRRQFLLGKFAGITLAAAFMTALLGWVLVWVVLFKRHEESFQNLVKIPDPAWVVNTVGAWFSGSSADLARGMGFWIDDVAAVLPGLVISFCQVMVLVAIAVALATRVPMVVNLTACLFCYFLGHLTPILTAVSQRGGLPLVVFVGQVFDTVLPELDLFDVGTAIVREAPLPPVDYALYTLNVTLYALTYTTIALLFGLVLFEDRDLA